MAEYFRLHPDNPQLRLIDEAARLIHQGAVVVYPTDSSYAIGCRLGDKSAVDRIRRIRQIDDKHYFTLICKDLSEIATYAKVDNQQYRLLKMATPGCYTFILEASREVPRRLQHPKRNTIGLRVPDHNVVKALLEALGEPLLSSTLLLPNDDYPLNEGDEIRERLDNQVDLILESGACGVEMTTVIDLTGDAPQLVRQGRGAIDIFGLE